MHRLLALPRYSEVGPSSRYRTYQFLPYLRDHGWDITVRPFLGEAYVKDLYADRRWGMGRIIPRLAARCKDLATSGRYDALWIEKESLPWVSSLPERILARLGYPFAVDYDDAIFHRYDQHHSPLVRRLLGHRIDRIMASSNLVIAGNTYLAERAWTAGARRVEILPTVVDLDRYPEPVNSEPQSAGPIRIGWIGSTLNESYLYEISDALARVHRQIAIELVVIGGSANFSIPGVPVRSVQWTQATEVADLADCDIGVMPLPDTPWSWGKCGFKLLQYMGAGLPVVASPIGANCDLVDQGVNGFLAGSPQEWEKSILALAMDGRLRTSMGIQGRRCLVSNYTIQAVAPKLEALLSSLINS